MIEHILYHCDHHLCSKAEDTQKQIYDLQAISTEELAYFINRISILHKKKLLSKKDIYPPNSTILDSTYTTHLLPRFSYFSWHQVF